MIKKLRNIIPAFFSALLAVPLLALLLLQVAQVLLKHSAGDRMHKEILQTIRIPADQVVWEKKEKEIVLEGKMFDIREYAIRDGIFTATGFFDDEESRIHNFLVEHASKDGGHALLQLLLFGQCFVAMIGWLPALLVVIPVQKEIPFYNDHYTDPLLCSLVPPPRLL